MPQVRINETPGERKQRIWSRSQYFKENDLLPIDNEKYFNVRKLISFQDDTSYTPTIGIVICLSRNELVYTRKNYQKLACTILVIHISIITQNCQTLYKSRNCQPIFHD